MKLQEVLTKTTQFFKQKGIPSARLDSELIISRALGWSRMDLYLKTDYPMQNEELDRCREFVRRRASGEPVAYIFGEKEFYSRSFEVNQHVLIPRPETEHLVDEGLAYAKDLTDVRIIDLGTGSGCIGLTLLKELAGSRLLSVDVSIEALKVATRNAEKLEVADRAIFREQSAETLTSEQVTELLGGLADLVMGNPPYIAHDDPNIEPGVRKFEPSLALFSDDHGMKHIRDWAHTASSLLKTGGALIFEIGSQQGALAADLCRSSSAWRDVQVMKDYSGHDRILKAIRT